MPTLCLRNVPADVLARLKAIARSERSSVSAVTIRELDTASRRADNAQLLAALPDTGVDIPTVLRYLEEGRSET